MARAPQLPLDLPSRFGWGGARAGSGQKPRGEEAGISHERVIEVDGRSPVHVTVRARAHVWNLRSVRCHAIIATALRGVLGRRGFRVVHFSIQGNHLHLVIEADDTAALASGMKSISGRIAKGLNRLMQRTGRVFTDRYHAACTTALIDRLVHHSEIISIEGESYRKREAELAKEATATRRRKKRS